MSQADPWQSFLSNAAQARTYANLERRLHVCTSVSSARVQIDGSELISFASNDYLGLAHHPALRDAAFAAIRAEGLGASASRLITGTSTIHQELEAELAIHRGYEAALTFTTGYQANVGVIASLADQDTLIFSDQLNHASIVDGCRLSRAEVRIFPNRDLRSLEAMLKTDGSGKRRLIVSESLFSIDGVVADLPGLVALARTHDALLVVDDAHAYGAIGEKGNGLPELQGLAGGETDVLVGTFSKALGSLGGYACTSQPIREHLVNSARSLIFTTAASHADVAGALAALRLLATEESVVARKKLILLSDELRRRLVGLPFEVCGSHHIVALIVEQEELALHLSRKLRSAGFLVPAIRPPTVPKGRCALRFSLCSAHTSADIEGVVSAIEG